MLGAKLVILQLNIKTDLLLVPPERMLFINMNQLTSTKKHLCFHLWNNISTFRKISNISISVVVPNELNLDPDPDPGPDRDPDPG